jgi:hypothetical protein
VLNPEPGQQYMLLCLVLIMCPKYCWVQSKHKALSLACTASPVIAVPISSATEKQVLPGKMFSK